MNIFSLIFVCTGNICRSPMAEGIMKDLVLDEIGESKQFMPIEIMSAGIYAIDGNTASQYAIEVSVEHGINLRSHYSRLLTDKIAKSGDLILTMEKNHTDYIYQYWPNIDYAFQLKLYGQNDDQLLVSEDIMDPIGMEIEVYKNVFAELKREIQRVSQKIFSLAFEKYHAG